jgi:excisionase family DNA binding protein
MTQIHPTGSSEHSAFTGRPINGKLLLTVSEAAAALRISRSSIYRLFEARELAWVQIGASRRGYVGGDSRVHRGAYPSCVVTPLARWLNAASFHPRSDALSY